MKKIFIAIIITAGTIFTQTGGSAMINFKTLTYGGAYGPRHCLSAWITDSRGVFVRTLEVRAHFPNYGRYLTKWVASSSHNIYSNTILDAVTGASQYSHTSHSLTWNLKDYTGAVVPDGTYKINLEFTEINGTGKYYSFPFEKSMTNSIVTAPDQSYFKNMSVQYTAPTSIENQPAGTVLAMKSYPNPFNNSCSIEFTLTESGSVALDIYDAGGVHVKTLIKGRLEKGEHKAVWDGIDNKGRSLSSGQSYFVLNSDNGSEIKRAILLK